MTNRVDYGTVKQSLNEKLGANIIGGLNFGKNIWGRLNSSTTARELACYMNTEYRTDTAIRVNASREKWNF